MAPKGRSLQEATDDLFERIDDEVLEDFMEDEFGEEHVVDEHMDGLFCDVELDYLFSALVDSYTDSLENRSGMIPSCIQYRMIRKLTERFDRWEVDEEQLEQAVEQEEESHVSRTFQ